MATSTLGLLTLAYQLVWNARRQVAAVQLFLQPDGKDPVEGAHFQRTASETWSGHGPALLLTPLSCELLIDLLDHAQAQGPQLVVQQALLAQQSAIGEAVQRAHARGLPLLWRGAPGERPDPALASCFTRCMLGLTAGDTVAAARASLHPERAQATGQGPMLQDQIVEAVPSRLMASHSLDQQGAWGVAGWPSDDVLLSQQRQAIQPGHTAIKRLMRQVDADAALDLLEHTLGEEPLLAYRFLRHANSAALGRRSSVDSLRNGLMLLGLTRFRAWLVEQLALAIDEPDLDPVRLGMVLRARLMENLLDAGEEDALRREVFLTGVLSQIDGLLGEPLREAILRLPLSERVQGAILRNDGPYAPFLELAVALEYPHMDKVAAACANSGLALADVNRTLLRVLAQLGR